MPVKFEASMPSTLLPSQMYYCSISDDPPATVHVTTPGSKAVKIQPLKSGETPANISEAACGRAIQLGFSGVPTVHMIKNNGVHERILYVSPVRVRGNTAPVGVLIGVDEATGTTSTTSTGEESPSSDRSCMSSPEEVEQAMLAEMLRAPARAAGGR